MLGSMYTAANFMGTNNCSSILPLVSTERTVLYRERFAGMYSPWAYSFAQMFIEIPYVFLQAAFFVVITYPAFGYYWSASKFLWFFYTMFCTLLYFVYLGMFLVSLTSNLRVASILSSPCYAIINLFSGFMVPGPMSLAEAKRSLVADGRTNQQGLHDKSPNNHYFDSEDTTSQEFKTPESTPAKQPRASAAVLPVNSNGTRAAVSHMAKEFEQKKKDFEDDARLLIEVKSGQSPVIMNPDEELQKLKVRFVSWKKDYKVKLREAKAELQKIGNLQAMKPRRRWWSIWIRR